MRARRYVRRKSMRDIGVFSTHASGPRLARPHAHAGGEEHSIMDVVMLVLDPGALTLSTTYSFFLPPILTSGIADVTDMASLVFFMLVALIVSNAAAGARTAAVIAHGRVRSIESLYSFSKRLG